MIPQAPPPVSYSRRIVPILRTACLGCHAAPTPAGKLSVASLGELIKGGVHGISVVPGKSGQSSLFLRLTGAVKPIMPPGPGLETRQRSSCSGAGSTKARRSDEPGGKPSVAAPVWRRTPAPALTAIPTPLGKTLAVGAPVNALSPTRPTARRSRSGRTRRVLFVDPATRAVTKTWGGHLDSPCAASRSPPTASGLRRAEALPARSGRCGSGRFPRGARFARTVFSPTPIDLRGVLARLGAAGQREREIERS